MSMASLEREIIWELREVSGVPKLTMKSVREWSTSETKTQSDETHFFLPKLRIHCDVATVALGKKVSK